MPRTRVIGRQKRRSRATHSASHHLPLPLTPFVGREQELNTVCSILRRLDARLVTLTGPGGMGKTRLGLEVAHSLLTEFEDGVYFVRLAAITEPDLVLPTIAHTFDIKGIEDPFLFEDLVDYLREKHVLLLLDNFEQVVEAAPLVAELLSSCAGLNVLVTSREVLNVRGEHEYPVPPLSMPNPNNLPGIRALSQYEALVLFVQRATAARPNFQLTSANAPVVAEICARLDGLPLAIELAAARINLLSPQAMLARLGRRLQLLTGGSRDLPARQQTLKNTIEWSYDLLTPAERSLFTRLSVFAGGCTLEAVEEICTSSGSPEISTLEIDLLSGLESLIDQSLLRRIEHPQGTVRFWMLETIREYALDRLTSVGEEAPIRERHAHFFLQIAEKSEPELFGPRQIEWLDRLEAEHDNFRAILDWALSPGNEKALETGLRLASLLMWFWQTRGYLSEGRARLASLLTASMPLSGQAIRIARAVGLSAAARLAAEQGDHDAAKVMYEEVLAEWRDMGNKPGAARALMGLGHLARHRGEFSLAHSLYEESQAIRTELGDRPGVANTIGALGHLALSEVNYEEARALLEKSLLIQCEVGDKWSVAYTTNALAYLAMRQENLKKARDLFVESIGLRTKLGDRAGLGNSLQGLAELLAVAKEWKGAAALLGAADSQREELSIMRNPAEAAESSRVAELVRAQLGDEVYSAARSAGEYMPIAQAVDIANRAVVEPESKHNERYYDGLSKREVEVLRLVAQGLSDTAVAAKLHLSPHTVHAHLRTIFKKIGVSSRAAATLYATEHELMEAKNTQRTLNEGHE